MGDEPKAEFVFKGCLSGIKTDDMGNVKITFFVPMTEAEHIQEIGTQVNRVLKLTAKAT